MEEKKKCATNGPVQIRGVLYHSEMLSDMKYHYIRVFLPGGGEIEFQHNPNVYLKEDIEAALITHGIITEVK